MESETRYYLNNEFVVTPLQINNLNIIQIGRRYCKSNTVIPPHIHEKWFELSLITHGKGVITSNGIVNKVSTNDIHISLPYELHAIESVDNLEYDFFAFYYTDQKLANEFEKLSKTIEFSQEGRLFQNENISNAISNAIMEILNEDQFMSNELLYGLLTQVCIYLLRQMRDFANASSETLKFSSSNVFIFNVMNYIDKNILTLNNLTDISDAFNYNYSYLSNLFKQKTGKTISSYVQNRKLSLAVSLLSNKEKIGEIANKLGFSDQFAFSNAFKKKYGLSPKKYMKNSVQ